MTQPTNPGGIPLREPSQKPKNTKAGRGFIVSGAMFLALAVFGFIAAVAVWGSSVNLDDLQRDISVSGSFSSEIPGSLGFRVTEPLSGEATEMDVAVGVDAETTKINCTIQDASGEEVSVRRAGINDAFIGPEKGDFVPYVVAESLAVGDYVASCEGEELNATDQFSVGRVFTADDLIRELGPLFGVLAAALIGGVLSVLGVILLVVGFKRRSRAQKELIAQAALAAPPSQSEAELYWSAPYTGEPHMPQPGADDPQTDSGPLDPDFPKIEQSNIKHSDDQHSKTQRPPMQQGWQPPEQPEPPA